MAASRSCAVGAPASTTTKEQVLQRIEEIKKELDSIKGLIEAL
jgi:hypothetical protein